MRQYLLAYWLFHAITLNAVFLRISPFLNQAGVQAQKCKTLGVRRICIEGNSVALMTPLLPPCTIIIDVLAVNKDSVALMTSLLYLSMVPKDAVQREARSRCE